MILQTYPQYLFFQSLRTVALSVSSYEEFRSIPEHLDYTRLKQRCRQKFLQETVTKTLVVKGSVIITDLTDQVVIMGDSAVAHGSFADVWKGVWVDPIERRQRNVALKFLRQVMVKGVREKLIKVCFSNLLFMFIRLIPPNSVSKLRSLPGIDCATRMSVSCLGLFKPHIVLGWFPNGVTMEPFPSI